MKTSRGVLVIVLIAITISMASCRSTVIIPERYYPEEKLKLVHIFPVDLSELNSFTFRKIIDEHKDEVIFSNIDSERNNFKDDKFSTTKDHTIYAVVYKIQNAIMNSEEIIAFIKENNGKLPGDHGLILAWEQGRENFPEEESIVVGFSSKLSEGYGKSHKVLCVSKYSDKENWLFDYGCYEHKWYNNYCILFFVAEEDMGALFDAQH